MNRRAFLASTSTVASLSGCLSQDTPEPTPIGEPMVYEETLATVRNVEAQRSWVTQPQQVGEQPVINYPEEEQFLFVELEIENGSPDTLSFVVSHGGSEYPLEQYDAEQFSQSIGGILLGTRLPLNLDDEEATQIDWLVGGERVSSVVVDSQTQSRLYNPVTVTDVSVDGPSSVQRGESYEVEVTAESVAGAGGVFRAVISSTTQPTPRLQRVEFENGVAEFRQRFSTALVSENSSSVTVTVDWGGGEEQLDISLLDE